MIHRTGIATVFLVLFASAVQAANIDIVGSVGYERWNDSTIVLTAARIENKDSGGRSGTLYLRLKACNRPSLPATCYNVAAYRLGELNGNQYFHGISSGTIAATRPPNGTYHMIVMVTEYPNHSTARDSVTLSNTVTIGGGTTPAPTTGSRLKFSGTVGYRNWNSSTVVLTADRVENNASGGRSGTLHMRLKACNRPSLPATCYDVASYRLGELNGNQFYHTISSGTVAATRPPSGTYHMIMMLTEFPNASTAVDSRTMPDTVTIGGSPPPPPPPPGNGRSAAQAVGLNSTYRGNIRNGDDVDYYRFRMTRRGRLRATSASSIDAIGTLYNARGRELVRNDDCPSGGRDFCIDTQLAAGTYYLKVEGFLLASGSYRLRMNGPGGDDFGNTRKKAVEIHRTSETRGRLGARRDRDVFKIKVPRRGRLILHTTGGTNTKGRLLSSRGRVIASNDNGCGRGRNFCIKRTVAAGTYYLEVSGSRGARGSYRVRSRFN